MPYKKIGFLKFSSIPESIKIILKIKEDAWLCNFSKSFCEENKINPENLKFNILKDSKNKIWFAQVGTEQPSQSNKPTPTKMEIRLH
ncbi:MAG: hypothetical protein NPMRTHETA2_490006 [Nitrosopumilales archaeon]|nr:MAG: hypothetical protein NPMRTHETA2_490006 [Nitrosopumilales archaeon]